jgi:hypothetical protein
MVNDLLNFARVRMSDVGGKRDERSSARFGGVRSVFREEWAREVKADLVQGLTTSQHREFFFFLGNAIASGSFRFGDGNNFGCFAHAKS